jgi:hypothetical protein
VVRFRDPVTRTPRAVDHEKLADEVVAKLRKAAATPEGKLLHNAIVDRMTKIAMNDDYAWGFRPIEERIATVESYPDYPRKAKQLEELKSKLAAERALRPKARKPPTMTTRTTAALKTGPDMIVRKSPRRDGPEKRAAGEEMMDPAAAGGPATGMPDAEGKPPEKVPQKEAQYGPATSAARSCAMCVHFDGQSQCDVVDGEVQPTGTSMMFQGKAEMAGLDAGAVAQTGAMAKIGVAGGPLLAAAALSGLAGAPIGAAMAPKGRRWEGAGRGAVKGRFITGLGGGGGVLGALAGHQLAGESSDDRTKLLAALAGGVVGGVGGGVGGNALGDWVLGPPSWEVKQDGRRPGDSYKDNDKEAAAEALDDLYDTFIDDFTDKLATYPGCASRHRRIRRGKKKRRTKRGEDMSLVKCACGCPGCVGSCGRKKPVRTVRPERREAGGQFKWQGRNSRDITDDPQYEKYTRKSAELALAGILGAKR